MHATATFDSVSGEDAAASAGTGAKLPPRFTAGLADGLGDRVLTFDDSTSVSLELLRLKREFSDHTGFEAALRERVELLGRVHHPSLGSVRSVDRRGAGDGLTLVSKHTAGRRLSTIIHDARGAAFAQELIGQLAPALALLQQAGPGVAHGVLTPERIVVTREGRLVIVEHVLGSAIAALGWPPARLQGDLGLALPSTAPAAALDARTDVIQLGFIALSLLLGRRLDAAAYPAATSAWLSEVATTDATAFAQLRTWLERALQLGDQPFANAAAARDGFIALATPGAHGSPATPRPPASAAATQVAPASAALAGPLAASPARSPVVAEFSSSVEFSLETTLSAKPAADASEFAGVETTFEVGDAPVTRGWEDVSRYDDAEETFDAGLSSTPSTSAPAPARAVSSPAPAPAAIVAPVAIAPITVPKADVAAPRTVIATTPSLAPVTPVVTPLLEVAPSFVEAAPAPARLMPTSTTPAPVAHVPDRPLVTPAPAVAAPVAPVKTGAAASLDKPGEKPAEKPREKIETPRPADPGPKPEKVAVAAPVEALLPESSARPPFAPAPKSMNWAALLFAALAVGEAAVIAGLLYTRPASVPEAIVVRPPAPTEIAQTAGLTPILLTATTPPAAPAAAAPSIAPHVPSAAPEPARPVAAPAAAPAPTPAPAPAVRGGFGGIRVSSPIELQVFENGTLLGSSAGTIAVNEGAHALELVSESLGFRFRQAIDVKPGQMASLQVAVPNGRISINAVPWASVSIDGTPAGDTPLANLALPIGTHEIVFRHPQFGEQRQTVVVKAEGLTRVSASLQR